MDMRGSGESRVTLRNKNGGHKFLGTMSVGIRTYKDGITWQPLILSLGGYLAMLLVFPI